MKGEKCRTVKENNQNPKNPHCISLENRQNLVLSGIKEVGNYDDNIISIYTEMGKLIIKGQKLNIKKLNLEFGDLEVEGKISSIVYAEEKEKNGFFSKFFK